jgi:transcriptional regulator with XRE-family HTH domain
MSLMTLAHFVTARRKELGLSQRALAKKGRISHSAVNRLEAVEVIPGTETLEALAVALEVPLSHLADLLQGKPSLSNQDPLVAMLEQLPAKKRKLAEAIISLIAQY